MMWGKCFSFLDAFFFCWTLKKRLNSCYKDADDKLLSAYGNDVCPHSGFVPFCMHCENINQPENMVGITCFHLCHSRINSLVFKWEDKSSQNSFYHICKSCSDTFQQHLCNVTCGNRVILVIRSHSRSHFQIWHFIINQIWFCFSLPFLSIFIPSSVKLYSLVSAFMLYCSYLRPSWILFNYLTVQTI